MVFNDWFNQSPLEILSCQYSCEQLALRCIPIILQPKTIIKADVVLPISIVCSFDSERLMRMKREMFISTKAIDGISNWEVE